MPTCATYRIEISDADGSYSTSPPASNPFILCDFDDELEEEMASSTDVISQDSQPIDAINAVVRGRSNKNKTLTWARTITHATHEDARRYLMTHPDSLPGTTVGAQITFKTDAASTSPGRESDYYEPAAGFETYRAHVEAYPGELVTGTDTTVRYSLRWQMDTQPGGGAPPPDDNRLLTNGGDNIFSPRSPQILIFH